MPVFASTWSQMLHRPLPANVLTPRTLFAPLHSGISQIQEVVLLKFSCAGLDTWIYGTGEAETKPTLNLV